MMTVVLELPVLAAALLVALAPAVGPPTAPPPRVDGTSAEPPPAWVEAGTRSRWLAYSSFCWTTACVDFIPPQSRPDLPAVSAKVGTTVRFHLRFMPRTATLALLGPGGPQQQWKLAPGRVIEWRVRRGGVLLLSARASAGSAGYAIRLRTG